MFKKIITLVIAVVFFSAFPVSAGKPLDVYMFYGEGCPHCKKEKAFFESYLAKDRDVILHKYEVWSNQANAKLLERVSRELGANVSGVPILFVGDEYIVGFDSPETTGIQIESLIGKYKDREFADKIKMVLNNQDTSSSSKLRSSDKSSQTISTPFFGTVSLKNLSLPVLTMIIGAVDGFNPCALWILLFLMSLLITMGDRKRMWLLGTAFIATSGLVYFVFLAAWLNFSIFLGFTIYLRYGIALVALASGVYYLREYYKTKNDPGCEVINTEERKKVFYKIRNVINNNNLIIAFFGICLLAASVNLLEFLCSIGLPAVYTNILAGSNIGIFEKYLYLFMYILFYESEAIFVFLLTMWTTKLTGISSKFGLWSRLIGGIVMLLIGILLLFRPEWIMLS